MSVERCEEPMAGWVGLQSWRLELPLPSCYCTITSSCQLAVQISRSNKRTDHQHHLHTSHHSLNKWYPVPHHTSECLIITSPPAVHCSHSRSLQSLSLRTRGMSRSYCNCSAAGAGAGCVSPSASPAASCSSSEPSERSWRSPGWSYPVCPPPSPTGVSSWSWSPCRTELSWTWRTSDMSPCQADHEISLAYNVELSLFV